MFLIELLNKLIKLYVLLSNMEFRKFGLTGHQSSILTLGGFGIGFTDQETADKYIQKALDAKINTIDVAPTYGDAEKRLAPWVENMRDRFFLAEKTTKRTKEDAWKELKQSLKTLRTDYFDSYQFHAVNTLEDLEKIFSSGGAMEAFQQAKESDIIKNIGITGHTNIQVLIEALKRFDFQTVLCPIYIAAMVAPHPVNDFRPLLKIAKEKNVGVTAIKAVAKSRWTREKDLNTWYQPVESQEWINKAINYTLSQKGVTTYSITGEKSLWPKVIQAFQNYHKLDETKQKEIIQEAKNEGFKPLFPDEKEDN